MPATSYSITRRRRNALNAPDAMVASASDSTGRSRRSNLDLALAHVRG
jgi:hypothetical protein